MGAPSCNDGGASSAKGSFASATPELAAKLTKQFERIEGQNSSTHHVLLDDDTVSDDGTGLLDEAEDADHPDGGFGDGTDSEEEPLDYLMMDVAARLPESEAAHLMDRIRRFERRHARVERELRVRRASDGMQRMQSRSSDARSSQKTSAEVTSSAGKSEDESGGDANAGGSRACSTGGSTDKPPNASSGSTGGSREGASTSGAAVTASYAKSQSNQSRSSSCALCFSFGVVIVSIAIAAFRLVDLPSISATTQSANETLAPTVVPPTTGIADSSEEPVRVVGQAEPEVPSVAQIASELESLASLPAMPPVVAEAKDVPGTPESRAVARARELAAEHTKTQEMKRALEAAAQRLVAASAPQARAPLPASASSDPAARRAALRERVKQMEEHNTRKASEVSSSSP